MSQQSHACQRRQHEESERSIAARKHTPSTLNGEGVIRRQKSRSPSPPRSSSSHALSLSRRKQSPPSLSKAQKSLSDSIVSDRGGRSSREWGGCPTQPPRTNATFCLVQRSGSKLVKDIIESMDRKVAQRTGTPDTECAAISNCALDPYYRVIVAASGGIASIVRAMEAFPAEECVQASGCAALASVSSKSASNQSVAGREGALEAVLSAMRTFPLSVGVQCAACDALNSLTSLNDANVTVLRGTADFESIMEHALERFMPSSCREGAKFVLRRTRATP